MLNVKKILHKKIQFYKEDIWKIHTSRESNISFFDRVIKMFLAGGRKFNNKGCLHKASALTYYTLLSLVPVLAMVFGIAKGFGYEKTLENILLQKFEDKKDILIQIFNLANSLLENTHGGMIAGIGLVVLFWSVMKVLGNIESVLNDVWDVKKHRTATRKLSDYFSIMLLCPVVLIVSNSATIYITKNIHDLALNIHMTSYFEWMISFILKIIPFSLVWFGLTFIYIVMPNTKVKFKPAFIGGVIAGIMFQIGQWIYIHSQVSMASYNAIYGSFAAIPLFLLWLQTSWYIVMFGAAISNTIQNGLNTEFQNDEIILSHNQKLFFSTWAMRIITKRFEDGEGATDQDTIAHCTGMSIFLTRFILKRLENAELISRIHGKDKDSIQYLPALSTNLLTTYYIENKLDKLYEQKISFSANNEFKKILLIMEERQDALNNSPANKLVTDI